MFVKMKKLDPNLYGLKPRTKIFENSKKKLFIVIDRKTRIIMKDGFKIFEIAQKVQGCLCAPDGAVEALLIKLSINFKRKGLIKIIDYCVKGQLEEIIVAYKDRLCRFGFDLIELLIKKYSNGKIIILNASNESPQEELTTD